MRGIGKSAAQAVADLLALQHKALLTGDLESLGQMAPDLERAFARLGREGASKPHLEGIKDTAARNARMLQAAQEGVSAARAHLQKSRSPQLTTYGADGTMRACAPAASHTFARR